LEQVPDRDVEDAGKGEKTTCRDPIATLLELVDLLIADTELPGHLVLGQASPQA
jgi:hypothetical protein